MTMSRTGQKSPALLLCIFFTLLAIDAIASVGECVQTFERDRVAALVAVAESVGRAIEATQCFVDVPEEPSLLAGEEECLLALHGVRPLVRHVERVAAQVTVRALHRVAECLVGAAELLEHPA